MAVGPRSRRRFLATLIAGGLAMRQASTSAEPVDPAILRALSLPNSEAAIASLFARLPELLLAQRVNGPPQVEPYAAGYRVTYGPAINPDTPTIGILATHIASGGRTAEFPTVAHFIEVYGQYRQGRGSDFTWTVEGVDIEPDLAWLAVIQADTSTAELTSTGALGSIRTIYHLWWGHPESPWLFRASSITPEGRDAITTSFALTTLTSIVV